MNLNEEYEKRRKFLEFLEANGLRPKQDKRILELAPDISLSISKLLVEKYKELYKVFIVSPKFKYDNKYGIKGVRGEVDYYLKGLTFDVPKTKLNDKNLPKKLFTGEYKLPKETDFDTLLIYGILNQNSIMEMWKSRRIYGEVFKGSSRDYLELKNFYNQVMTYLNYMHYKEYQYIEEQDSKNKETYFLIKNK